jgi:hypothetical protein
MLLLAFYSLKNQRKSAFYRVLRKYLNHRVLRKYLNPNRRFFLAF